VLAHDHSAFLHVKPVPGVLVNLHFWGADSVNFDCDPRELQEEKRLEAFSRFVRALGRKLSKPVILGLEGCVPDRPDATCDPRSGRIQVHHSD
jgi:hypothetical protein